MLLYLYLNKLFKAYVYTPLISLLPQFVIPERLSAVRYANSRTLERTFANPDLSWHYKAIRGYWTSIGLCILLTLLNSANGTFTISRQYLPSPRAMAETLKAVGVVFQDPSLTFKPFIRTTQYQYGCISMICLAPATLQDYAPRYVVSCACKFIWFHLPHYCDIEEATTSLAELKKISVIRSIYPCHIEVNYNEANHNFELINLRILNRVINMFDCKLMTLKLIPISHALETKSSPLKLDTCREEAQQTVNQARYIFAGQIQFETKTGSSLIDLLDSDIVLLRLIEKVWLRGNEFKYLHLLGQLMLIDGYGLCFSGLPRAANIDFEQLRSTLPARCGLITIEELNGAKLLGLRKAVNDHPNISLELDWNTLKFMSQHNQPEGHIYTILGLTITRSMNKILEKARSTIAYNSPWLFVTTICLKIPSNFPCQSLGHYEEVYNKQAFANYGVSVNDIQIDYEERDNDI
ncbi:hypothetical protein NEHOM01_0768 [Nematocida homosporus]|uniref:uncharacterized protein n=1 Tax=Nematocida homosporus TaxID=1912981 RepID=UPI00221E381F|nr:uncharacterized protein NEHOM01_0768 [Nematocida homosporus]KAI5185353.1 hypothetical protein NEHOM01_0768 [Nematocida homosporus]